VVEQQVQEALNDIRPHLQADGGDIELVEVTADGIVKVRLVGACSGCPGAAMTLQLGVERAVKERVPEIKGVEAV
jgi:Fe-S cluster biogenesis protein NfuA